jgi:succinyl-CoA synthetase beta subunit
MKKLITTILLLLPVFLFSQQLTYRSGGRVYNSENKKIEPSEVRELMAKNTAALKLYNTGRTEKTIGNIFFFSGIGLVATDLVVSFVDDGATFDSSGNAHKKEANHSLALVGAAMVVVSIPFKIGCAKKVRSAISEYNKGVVSNEVPSKLTLLANNQGLGLRIQF